MNDSEFKNDSEATEERRMIVRLLSEKAQPIAII